MDVKLKQEDLADGVDGLATNQVHHISIDSRCFEVAAVMSQFDNRLDGVIKVEVDGKTFEKPLREGYQVNGSISFRFFTLPWGSKATVTIVLDPLSEGAKPTTRILLEDVPISGVAAEGETPKGGSTKAAGSGAPAASKGKATEKEDPGAPKLSLRKGDGSAEELKKK